MKKILFSTAIIFISIITICDAQTKIPLDARRFYQLNNFENDASALVDNNTNTVFVGGWGQIMNSYEMWYEFPEEMKVEVSKFSIFDGEGMFPETPIEIFGIMRSTATNWTRELLGTFTGGDYMTWKDINLSSSKPIKYIILKLRGQRGTPIPEFEAWGTYTSYTAPTVVLPRIKFKNYLGVNTYEWNLLQNQIYPWVGSQPYEPKWDILKNYHTYRHYLDWKKLELTKGQYGFSATQDGGWNLDTLYARLSSEGRIVVPVIKSLPPHLLATYPGKDNEENVPKPYNTSYDYDLPGAYIDYAKMMFQVVARYGSTQVPASLLSVRAGETKRTGLGYLKYVEVENERDKWWRGRKAYQTGREYAAYLSAVYDGHLGTMGEGVGVKNADPFMKVVIGGTAQSQPDYARGIIDWCKEFRNDSLPFDVSNYHFYSTDAGTSQLENGKFGVAPETGTLVKFADDYNYFRQQFGRNKEVWMTETGYDTSNTSRFSTRAIGNRSNLQTHGDWIIRTALAYAEKRHDRLMFFELYDQGGPGIFGTSGHAETNLTKRPALQYIEQIGKILGDWEFDEKLSNNPRVDRYVKNGSFRYVAWMPSETGATGSYLFSLTNAAAHLKKYSFADDQSHMKQSYLPVNNGTASITITETPVIFEETATVETFTEPSANAGDDATYTLPATNNNFTIELAGTGSGNGALDYRWKKLSGPGHIFIESPYQPITKIYYLAPGIYFFELKVTNQFGTTDTDTVMITINNVPGNQLPVAHAGDDFATPDRKIVLNALASTDDKEGLRYAWRKIEGSLYGTMYEPYEAICNIDYLDLGVYKFELMVTDKEGAIDFDTIQVTIGTLPPVARAGSDHSVPFGYATVLNGSTSSDQDGTITSYLWEKFSGPSSYNLVSPREATSWLNTLTSGHYVFKLTVTDNHGKTAWDTVSVKVTNRAPVANAGTDISLQLGYSTVLNGRKSSDADGTITTWQWSKVSGPSSYNFVSPTLDTTWLNSLVEGVYVFRLTATDNAGATAFDEVQVTVTPAPSRNVAGNNLFAYESGNIKLSVSAFPNPAVARLNYSIEGNLNGAAEVRIIDVKGRILKRRSIVKEQVKYTNYIPVDNLADGMYTIQFIFKDLKDRISISFVK